MRWSAIVVVASLASVAASPWAGSAEAATPAASPEQVQLLVDQWRIEEAAKVATALLREQPESAEAQFADGRVRFEEGDYAGAVAQLDAALEHAPEGAEAGWRGLRELVASTAAATSGYREARSPEGHFVVRYTGRDELLLPYAFATLEAARREIAARDFDATLLLGEPVRVEIYPEVASLAKVSTLTEKEIETSGTIALCKFNRLMIVSPRALVHGYPWLDTLAHEYTHYVVSRVSYDTVPIWLHEGLAKFEERRWRMPAPSPSAPSAPSGAAGAAGGLTPTMEHLLATALSRGRRLITFEEMYPSMAKLPSQADTALAFAEVYTVVEYLHQRRGWQGVRDLLGLLKGGAGDARAVAEVAGEPFADFQRDWKAWLRARKLRTHPGLVPASLRFVRADDRKRGGGGGGGKDALDDDADDKADAGDVVEERAKKFARLGAMLRGKSRLSAAAMEYEKAQALVGGASPQVAHKLARTLLELGQPARAVAAAEAAFELYPDNAGLATTLGEANLRLGERAKARTYLEAALRVNPFDPRPHCALAGLYDAGAAHDREAAACAALGGN